MTASFTFLISGIIFGLSSGITPGPLLTLVISETVRHGIREGVKVAIAPLVTDIPIVLTSIIILTRLSDVQSLLGVISMAGAGFLIYLGIESLGFTGADIDSDKIKPRSLQKGVIANFLNPSPYLFWVSIGAPTVVKAMDIGLVSTLSFIVSFYILLVGSKVMIAFVTGRSRHFLKSKSYIYTIKILGIMLLIFALLFIRNGLICFGLI